MDNEAIKQIIIYRNRFQAWGLLISILSLLAAMWVTAPTLEIDIPLAGGAKASINVGYVIALGPVFISFSLAWAIGSLVSMRRYQIAAISEIDTLLYSDKISIIGPLSLSISPHEKNHLIKFVGYFRKSRSTIFFIIPVVAQLIILENMFDNLHYYNPDNEIKRFNNLNESEVMLESNWALSTKPVDMSDFFFSKRPEKGSSYTLQNSGLNQECGAYIYLQSLNKKITLNAREKTLSKRLAEISPKCIPVEFPKYELALNTWVNLIMLLMVVISAYYGWIVYSSARIVELVDTKMANK